MNEEDRQMLREVHAMLTRLLSKEYEEEQDMKQFCINVAADTKSRLEYDLYRQRLRQTMHDLKIKDEDAWAVADRYVQDNLDVLSIW